MTHRRTGLARAGITAVAAGLLLAIFGLVSPAEAAKPNTFKVELCHRTNAPTNPYRVIEVSVDASNGEIVGPDHTGHPGPVFDYTADPADPGYPYTSPRNGDQWGDIIPSYEYEGGTFPGQNWTDEGQAIFENGCQGPDEPEEPEDPACPEGQVWDDANENDVIDDGECSAPVDPQPLVAASLACASPSGMKVTLTNTGEVSGLVDITSDGVVVHDEVVVPVGDTVERVVDATEDEPYDIAVVDVETFTGTRDCVQAGGVVIPKTPEKPVKPAPQVKGSQVQAQELPRTGDEETTLALIGLGLVLIGAGAVLLSRDHATA